MSYITDEDLTPISAALDEDASLWALPTPPPAHRVVPAPAGGPTAGASPNPSGRSSPVPVLSRSGQLSTPRARRLQPLGAKSPARVLPPATPRDEAVEASLLPPPTAPAGASRAHRDGGWSSYRSLTGNMQSQLGKASAAVGMCDYLESKMQTQQQALRHLEARCTSQNTHALEAALAARDEHIAKLEGSCRQKEEDMQAMQATLEKVQTESATGAPVQMKPTLAAKVQKALGGALARMQADNLVRSPNIGRLQDEANDGANGGLNPTNAAGEFAFDVGDVAAMPGWTLEAWLGSLGSEQLVAGAISSHIQAKSGRKLDPLVELGFMQQLGKVGSREVVVAMLRQTPLIDDLADALWAGVEELAKQVEEDRAIQEQREQQGKQDAEDALRALAAQNAGGAAPAGGEGEGGSTTVDELADYAEDTPEEEALELQDMANAAQKMLERDVAMKEERRQVKKQKREVERQLAEEDAKEEESRLQTALESVNSSVDDTRVEYDRAVSVQQEREEAGEQKDAKLIEELEELQSKLRAAEEQAAQAHQAMIDHAEAEKKRIVAEAAAEEEAEAADEAARKAEKEKLNVTGWKKVQLRKKAMMTVKKKKKLIKSDGRSYNESLKLDTNARHLSYAPVKSYFTGLASVVGRCMAEPGNDAQLLELMYDEHTKGADSDAIFEPSNYGIPTTSRIEYWAVYDPKRGLEVLGLDDYPKEQRGDATRVCVPPEAYRAEWDAMNAKLAVAGEPALKLGGFIALRLYTGPMFFKYNTVLRGVSVGGMKAPMEAIFMQLCHGNKYTNTLHAITAAISKLGRVTRVSEVYRAPGGVLPKHFWDDDAFGVKGGVEMGFMSTSRSKHAAMEYAKFSGVKLIFELNQGMVSRGADVSWLSMYPKEDEVLFPPMCACEVQKTRVEGSIVVVELRPGVAACALQDPSLEMQEEEEAKRREEAAKRKRAIDEAAKTRAQWMSSMLSVKVTAAEAKRMGEAAKAKEAERQYATETERAAKLREEKEALEQRLKAMEEYHEANLNEANLAAESRVKTLEAQQTLQNAQRLAHRMVGAAMKVKLAENDITLKSLVDAQEAHGRGKILDKFRMGLTSARMDEKDREVAEIAEKLKVSKEKQAELQVRTLTAEDKVQKLTKKLAENKQMLDKLMERQ